MDELERELRARLRAEPTRVPASVDAAVLAHARRHRPKAVLGPRRIAVAIAAAAAALVLWLAIPPTKDGDGRLDMVDAYRLALRIDAGAEYDARWDRNADGVLDARDVEAIARGAVALDEEGRS